MSGRKGLRIVRQSGVHPEVVEATKFLAIWLRKKYDFPIRVPVYLSPKIDLKSSTSENRVSAKFFAPYDQSVEPYISISTGEYLKDKQNEGVNNALASILGSVIHEVLHYQQWINDKELSEAGIDKDSDKILEDYATDAVDPLFPYFLNS